MEKLKGAEMPTSIVDRTLIETWLTSTEEGKRLSPEEGRVFMEVAIAHNLNPFCRELHARIQLEDGVRKLILLTGFEVYLSRAAKSGFLDGYSSRLEGEGESLKAVVEIHRKDWTCPYIGEAYFSEVAQRDDKGELLPFWKRSGKYMLRKVCLSQSFRLAFPEVLGGLPYEGAEMPQEKGKEVRVAGKTDNSLEKAHGAEMDSRDTEATLAERIKLLALQNQSLLKPHHVTWIIEQLNQPKSIRQLEGLKAHVERAIEDAKAIPAKATGPEQRAIRRIPPARLRPSRVGSSTVSNDKAAGAEGIVF
jgi:hypothetical protein